MSDTTTEHPFDVGNRAYQRLLVIAPEHLDVAVWKRDSDERPVMITLTDIDSRDVVTLAVMDSHEETAPHALLAATIDGELHAYGPFAGSGAAHAHAARLALAQPDIAATRPVPLHDPNEQPIPGTAWIDAPHAVADMVTANPADSAARCLILFDRAHHCLVAVGPFTTQQDADDWQPQLDQQASRSAIALRPAPCEGD